MNKDHQYVSEMKIMINMGRRRFVLLTLSLSSSLYFTLSLQLWFSEQLCSCERAIRAQSLISVSEKAFKLTS